MRNSARRAVGGLVLGLLPGAPALCDEVFLRGGGRISGQIVERTASRVAIETGPGRVTFPMSRVERIVDGRSDVAAFEARSAALAPNDVEGWASLARWAEDASMQTRAESAWRRVLAFDPRHPEANAAVGRVLLDGVYVDAAEAYRARGFVSFEGRWLTPAEHEATLRERAAEQSAQLEAREANLRIREAEVRAWEAEARASEARTASDWSSSGIPVGYASGWGWGYGSAWGVGNVDGVGGVGVVGVDRGRGSDRRNPGETGDWIGRRSGAPNPGWRPAGATSGTAAWRDRGHGSRPGSPADRPHTRSGGRPSSSNASASSGSPARRFVPQRAAVGAAPRKPVGER